MKTLVMLGLVLSVTGCATTRVVTYNIESEPAGAAIESNGVTICDSTPCKIELQCKERNGKWKSKDVILEATPRRALANQGDMYAQRKHVNPCSASIEGKIFFNLGLEKVKPTTPIEIKNR